MAVRSMKMNQQYILLKVSLKRNKDVNGYVLNDWWKYGYKRFRETKSCISPRRNGLIFANSVFVVTLWNITNNENWL
jgi:hypothetical protein